MSAKTKKTEELKKLPDQRLDRQTHTNYVSYNILDCNFQQEKVKNR